MGKRDDTTTEDESKRVRLPMVRRIENAIAKSAEGIAKHAAKVGKFESAELDAQFKTAIDELRMVVTMLSALPDDVGKKRRTSVSSAFSVGMLVDVKERFASNYEGLLEPEDLQNLEILKVAKGKLSVKTQEGVCMFLPKTHLVPVGAEAA